MRISVSVSGGEVRRGGVSVYIQICDFCTEGREGRWESGEACITKKECLEKESRAWQHVV